MDRNNPRQVGKFISKLFSPFVLIRYREKLMTLLREIEVYLRQTGLAPTTLGRKAAHDPRFVSDLRRGRTVGDTLRLRIIRWMREHGA
jgi:hypothetical protein